MNDSTNARLLSRQVRQDYLGAKAAQRKFADLRPLILDPDMLADDSDGTLKSEYLLDPTKGVTLNVPHWLFSDLDRLKIELSYDGLDWLSVYDEEVNYFDNPDKYPNPYPVKLDLSNPLLNGDGPHIFRTWIRSDEGDVSTSPPCPLIFDRQAPYGTAYPKPFPSIPAVTDDRLSSEGDKVILDLPAYADGALGDHVAVYWLKEVPDDIEKLVPVRIAPTTGGKQSLEVAGDEVRKVGDGGVYAVYVLRDKAGNVSRISQHLPVAVALGDLPDTFAPPTVPLATAMDSFLIDQADASLGVEVWVPVPEHAKAEDFVQVIWGGIPLDAEVVGSSPGDNVQVRVPNAVLLQHYGESTGAISTEVSYTILRGTHPLGGEKTTINVNLEIIDPAGPDPEWPNPINKKLHPVTVKGRGGSSNDNELNGDDAGKAADLKVILYDFVEENDQLDFYWNNSKAASYVVPAAKGSGDEVIVEVSWDVIRAGGNGDAIPVYYQVTRPGVHNPSDSRVTDVDVDAITITPIAANYLHLNSNGRVSCATIAASLPHVDGPAVEVQVPDLTEYAEYGEFTEVKMKWWVMLGRDDAQGTDPFDKVTLEVTLPIDADHPLTGFIWRVPFATNVEPGIIPDPHDSNFSQSRARVTYTLLADKQLLSEEAQVRLAFLPPSGECDPNNP
ncbi:hypothetical protein ACQKO7_09825 [Pseudomonas putida]|uniref:hypothetical protein n=1 Tax=Pseudomonas putida TaxID=303 RepID=UPI003CFE8468